VASPNLSMTLIVLLERKLFSTCFHLLVGLPCLQLTASMIGSTILAMPLPAGQRDLYMDMPSMRPIAELN
jgi:hypothetical protein